MFVCNMKVNYKSGFKIIFIILMIVILIIFGIGVYRVFLSRESTKDNCTDTSNISTISSSNFTNVLKTVHDNLDGYVGKRIRFTGFVYRLYDFSSEQFVLARQMIISSDYQAVVVGFLCHLNGADKYKDGCWVEVDGTITKGDYHGSIPVVEIEKIREVEAPSDEYVYPPTSEYVKTTNI